MAFLATNVFIADGVKTFWDFSFAGVSPDNASGTTPYLYAADVNNVQQAVVRIVSIDPALPLRANIVGAPVAAGRSIKIYRFTENRYPLVDYRDRQSVSEFDLDLANRQAIFIAQETQDHSANMVLDEFDNYDVQGRRIVNLGPGINPLDAVNKNQLDHAIRIPDNEPALPALPAAALRANRVMAFDSFGNPTVQFPQAGDATLLAMDLFAATGSTLVGSVRLEANAVRQTVAKRLNDGLLPTPFDFGATGNGIANDTAAFTTMLAALPANPRIWLPAGAVFKLDEGYQPIYFAEGPGSVQYGDTLFGRSDLRFDPLKDAVFFNPKSFYDTGKPSPGGNRQTMYLSPGAAISGSANRCTFVGTQGPRQIQSVDRLDGFGNGTFMYTRFCERSTMIGTIAGQWLGSNNPAADTHGWWSDAGGFTPGQVGWDYGGMETRNPGIGVKIRDFTGFATVATDCGRTVGVGRDAFNGTVMATGSVAIGYRAAAGAFAVSNLTALGSDAFRDGVFHTNSVAAGTFAASQWQEGTRNSIFGYNAAAGTVRGEKNTVLGAFAGFDYKDLNGSILIGHGAGNVIGGTSLTNVLAIGPDGGLPLISGRLLGFAAGINILPANIKGTFHIRTNDYGTVQAAHSSADDLIVENSGSCGITIRSGNTGFASLMFADVDSQNGAGLVFDHSTNEMIFRSGGFDKWRIEQNALFPHNDNNFSLGLASKRASVIYAGTGTINTSDAREKTPVRSLAVGEVRAGQRLVREIGVFQWLNSIEEKADGARLHIGMTVQKAIEILVSEGLDPFAYGMICFDKWEDDYRVDEEGEEVLHTAAGNRFAFREGQLHALMLAGMASTQDAILARLDALENN